MENHTKKCPMCAELIPFEATVCEYCGTQFEVKVIDGRVQSRFIEEALSAPAPLVEVQPAPLPERKGNSWLIVPIILLIFGAVGVLLWFTGKNAPAVPASKATITRAPTHAPTRAPNYQATTQARNTQAAATAEFTWVKSFAEPILSDIEDHSPNFEDDFSDLNGRYARWSYISGDVTFTEGIMRINTTGHDGAEAGGFMSAADFVLEFDFTPGRTSEGSTASTCFRWNETGGYGFNLNFNDAWWGMLSIPMEYEGRVLVEGEVQLARLNQTTSVIIIAKGDRFAFYVNGEPLFYTEDSSWEGDWLSLGVWSPNGPAEVDFDNVKFWDLNNLLP